MTLADIESVNSLQCFSFLDLSLYCFVLYYAILCFFLDGTLLNIYKGSNLANEVTKKKDIK